VQVRVEGARPVSQKAYVTSADPADDLRALPGSKAGSVVVVPARAVVTLVLQ